MTGTFINIGTVLAGTLVGWLAGRRLPPRLHDRVLAGLGLVTMLVGVDLGLAWRTTNPLYVLGGVLLGGLVGEALRIEDRIAALGDRLQAWSTRDRAHSTVSEAFLAPGSDALAALTSAGGILIIGISLKLLAVKDVKVGNFLHALVLAPLLVGLVSLVS